MMRILLVISKYLPEYTGAALRIHRLYQALGPGFSVKIVCGGVAQKDPLTWAEDGLQVERLRDLSSGILGRWKRLVPFYRDFLTAWDRLKEEDYDLLHVVGTSAQTCAALHYAALRKIPVVHELVTSDARPWQPLPILGKFLDLRLPQRSALVAISEPLGKRCADAGYAERCWVRPNPVDETRFSVPSPEKKAELRRTLTPFAPADRLLVMIAKFMPQKNQAFMLDVLEHLPSSFKLIMAGPLVSTGPLAARDQAYFDQLRQRASDRVLLLPRFIDKPEEYMQAADVYIMPNRDEGLGTPLLEAQACGLPVVANAGEAAFQSLIAQGQTGYLVPLDAAVWAKSVQDALSLAKPAQQASAIREKYSFSSTASTYRSLFSRLGQANSAFSLNEVHGARPA